MSDSNIAKLKVLATRLVEFADVAGQSSEDDRCFLLYGLTRDCGYKILAEADREAKFHAERKKAMGVDGRGEERRVG